MKKNHILLIALFLTPLIIYQWYMKLIWLKLDTNTVIYSYIYVLSICYIPAYLLIYKNFKVGYWIMWLVSIVLFCTQFRWLGFDQTSFLVSIDLWLNIIITIYGRTNTNKQRV